MITTLALALTWFAVEGGTLNGSLPCSFVYEGPPISDPPLWKYQQFLGHPKDSEHRMLTTEAKTALQLNSEELHALIDFADNLAAVSTAIEKKRNQWNFEYLMQSGTVSKEQQDQNCVWSITLMRQMQELKIAFGLERFSALDAFVRSGQHVFAR